jgi:uncharacterized protein with von Willebrand factor type A (vWA) domain
MKTKVPLAVHILLDSSGSMANNKGRALKAMNAFLDQLALSIIPASVSISRFAVSASAMIENALTYDLPRLTDEQYETMGGTNIFRAMAFAIGKLKAVDAETKIAIILTDGISDGSPSQCVSDMEEMKKQGWLFLFLGMQRHHGDPLRRELEQGAKSLKIEPEHMIVVPFDKLEDTMTKAALMCLDFTGTGQTKF